ncbi:MAG: TRAP transporter substrate-binding protein DctP [Deltaproteobacteria bacterium]|nr:TRAP transporter substrate-binding protein DctP [Deltaproteobacteria bacterium]NNK41200.1 TRAP transporter substrate-binding protein DctP [Myxococcales bacterium]
MYEAAKKSWIVFSLVAGCLFVGGADAPRAEADEKTVIRFATIAPGGSTFGKILRAWGRSLSKETEGRVELRYYSGGSQGDERDFIRKMRAGQMDAAGVTTIGLGIVVRPVLVLSAPGVIETYEELGRVRAKMNARFEQMFEDAGFVLLNWSDAGKGRIMSTIPIAKPADLKAARPWAWKDDPLFSEFLKVVGANPVRLGVTEVYAGLQTKMVDVVPASPIAALALQWFTKLKYMSDESFGIILGASLIKKDKFDRLSPDDQKVLKETARRAAAALDKVVRRDDAKAYDILLERGIQLVDTSPYRAQWNRASDETIDRLTGRIFSKSLLAEVRAAAEGTDL